MTRDDIIRMAREAGIVAIHAEGATNWAEEVNALERFAALVAAAEREAWPNLTPVILWLENGCDPKEAAQELRRYDATIRARGQCPPCTHDCNQGRTCPARHA